MSVLLLRRDPPAKTNRFFMYLHYCRMPCRAAMQNSLAAIILMLLCNTASLCYWAKGLQRRTLPGWSARPRA